MREQSDWHTARERGKGIIFMAAHVDSWELMPPAFRIHFDDDLGIMMRDMQMILRGLHGLNVIGGDVCEVSPPFDQGGMTALNAANLLFEILCLTAHNIGSQRRG